MTIPEAQGTWQPVLQVSSDVWLGLKGDRSSLWLGDFDQPKREVDVVDPIGLLPLLESPYSVIAAEIEDVKASWGDIVATILRSVIPQAVVETALRTNSDYWARLALAWLADINVPESLRRQVASIEAAPWASQPTRHAVGRLRRTWSSDAHLPANHHRNGE